jgi:pimeloyl-ACP methyl ester carboxylesterase
MQTPLERKITFRNRFGETLVGSLHAPAEHSSRGVVLGHCFTCSRHTRILQQISQDLARSGFWALRFDFSGNGQSEGVFSNSTTSRQISEMQAAAAQLTARGVGWLAMAGHSMGASVSVLAAARSPEVRAVCALAGRLSGLNPRLFFSENQRRELDRTGLVRFSSRGRELKLTGRFFSDADRFSLPRTIAALTIPLLVVHGDRDTIVPVAEATQARQANPAAVELDIVPGADHMFSGEALRQSVSARIVGWFSRLAERDAA